MSVIRRPRACHVTQNVNNENATDHEDAQQAKKTAKLLRAFVATATKPKPAIILLFFLRSAQRRKCFLVKERSPATTQNKNYHESSLRVFLDEANEARKFLAQRM
jgi:hypothetical protein